MDYEGFAQEVEIPPTQSIWMVQVLLPKAVS